MKKKLAFVVREEKKEEDIQITFAAPDKNVVKMLKNFRV